LPTIILEIPKYISIEIKISSDKLTNLSTKLKELKSILNGPNIRNCTRANEATIKAKLNLLNGLVYWIYFSLTRITNNILTLNIAATELAKASPV